jgi:hypothetical protein
MSESGRDAPTTRAPADAPPAIELETVPTRPTTPRGRLARIGLAVLICVVAGGVLLREIGLAQPEGTPVGPGPAGPAVLLSNVSYGAVTLNGQHLPGSPPLTLPLRNGWNQITFAARPFASRSCRLQWGAEGWINGDCPAIGQGVANNVVINGLVVRPATLIVIRLTGGDLPPSLYRAARAVMASQLATMSGFVRAVPVGEPIAVGGHWPDSISTRPAGQGARAVMSFGLYPDGSGEPRSIQCDFALCAGGLFYTTASASLDAAWNVAPDAYYVWRFADSGGNFDTSLPYPVSPTVTVPLTYDAALGWQPLAGRVDGGFPPPMEILLDGTFCDAGVYALNALTQTLGDTATVVGNSGMDGCVIALRTQKLQPQGRFIWRWGVLLAADVEAHATLPDLPVASGSEIAALGG